MTLARKSYAILICFSQTFEIVRASKNKCPHFASRIHTLTHKHTHRSFMKTVEPIIQLIMQMATKSSHKSHFDHIEAFHPDPHSFCDSQE